MSSESPSPLSFPQEHPTPFIGPVVLGLLIQGIETGIIINQSFTFWSRQELDNATIRAIVTFVTLVAFFQTSTTFYDFWLSHVTGYGDWSLVTTFMWVDKISPVVTALMASPIQAFFIWRCWHVTHKDWFTLISLSLVLLTSVASNIVTTIITLSMKFSVLVQDLSTLPKIPPNVAFILALTSSAVLDVAITIILLVYLSKAKANVYSSRVHRVMRQLVILIWEAAVPPCACAIIAVVTYLTMVNENWWDLMFQAILGKLYVISLFVTLNGRATIAENVNSSNDRLTSVAWVTSSPFGQNDVESQYQVSSTAAPVSDGDSGLKAGSPSGSERSKSDIRTLG